VAAKEIAVKKYIVRLSADERHRRQCHHDDDRGGHDAENKCKKFAKNPFNNFSYTTVITSTHRGLPQVISFFFGNCSALVRPPRR
jgi:hypothetical protein